MSAKLVTLYGDNVSNWEKNRRAFWLARQINRAKLMGADSTPYMDAAELLGIWGLVAKIAGKVGKKAIGEIKYRVKKARGKKTETKDPGLKTVVEKTTVENSTGLNNTKAISSNKTILLVGAGLVGLVAITALRR
jgi:hypothetical protein